MRNHWLRILISSQPDLVASFLARRSALEGLVGDLRMADLAQNVAKLQAIEAEIEQATQDLRAALEENKKLSDILEKMEEFSM